MYISIRNALMHVFELPMRFYENLRFGISSPRRRMIRVFYLFLLSLTLSPRVTIYFGENLMFNCWARLFDFDFSKNVFRHPIAKWSRHSVLLCRPILIDVSSKGVRREWPNINNRANRRNLLRQHVWHPNHNWFFETAAQQEKILPVGGNSKVDMWYGYNRIMSLPPRLK
jgi:hypothetical protein